MNENEPTNSTRPLPEGYRSGFLAAITVFLGFSLSFLRFWGLEKDGKWTGKGIISACIVGLGICVQLYALFRSLDVRDNGCRRYSVTVRYFFGGIGLVIIGVVAAIVVAA